MKIIKNTVIEAVEKLEYIRAKIDVLIEELDNIINELGRGDNSYELIKHIANNKNNLEIERENIYRLIQGIYTVLQYYEKCESDNVRDYFEEGISYVDKKSGVVDLSAIKDILQELNIIGG